jgi:hypothetical protein
MSDEPISAKERRKARAMVRDIAKQVPLYGEMASPDEWWAFFFSCLYGQEVLENPMRGELPTAPMFVLRNKRRTKDLNVSDGATFITLLYAFGNTRGVNGAIRNGRRKWRSTNKKLGWPHDNQMPRLRDGVPERR